MSAQGKIPAQALALLSRLIRGEISLNSSIHSDMDCNDYDYDSYKSPDVEMVDISSSDNEMNRIHEGSCDHDIRLVHSPILIVPSPNISNLNSSGSNISLENPIRHTSMIPDIEMTDVSSDNVSSNASSDNDMNRIHEGSSDNDIRQAHSPIEIVSDTSSNISSNVSNLSLEMAIKPSSTPKKIHEYFSYNNVPMFQCFVGISFVYSL